MNQSKDVFKCILRFLSRGLRAPYLSTIDNIVSVVHSGAGLNLAEEAIRSMKTKVSTRGRLILPASIRRQDRIEPGQEFAVERIERGVYRLVHLNPPTNEGLVDWLLTCPEKDYFVPLESGSTDML